jgi:hypothetical protein
MAGQEEHYNERDELLARNTKPRVSRGFLEVSDGTRTRGRRDHNPNNVVRLSAAPAL